ncbi:MAG: cell division protein FtsQ/DivIB [Burkholderiaceae bacterium]|jgi:cell division protein FtsQ|nr:cell division protein FtsQ/DivIB [Burkholderiaceae bacterium]
MTPTLPIPVDVKLMNLTVSLLVAALALGAIVAGLWWFARLPAFAIRQITIDGDTTHNSAASLRAGVAPRLGGTFFTMDLAAAQAAFQSTPWVRRALVRREFPNRLHVTLQEYVPAARWGNTADEADARMVNSEGEVFDASGGDGEDSDLPMLIGPDGRAPELLAMYRLLSPLAQPLGARVRQVALQARGNWQVELDSGAVIELGQGTPGALAARFKQFAATAKEVAARHERGVDAIEAADLRHADGYALRLRGVTTVRAEPTERSTPQPARKTTR